MFKKFIGVTAGVLGILFSFLLVQTTFAKGKPATIPERNGVYDDPEHPGIKVRVFVHQAKNSSHGKPNPSPTPAPSCVPTTDPDSTAVDGLTGWSLDTNWTYNLNPGSAPSGLGGDLATIAQNAFARWHAPTGINFVEGKTTSVNKQAYDGINTVAWGHTSGSALAVTYTRYYSSTGQVVDVDTIFNKQFAWTWSNEPNCAIPGAYDAQDILTHETGHWVGLDDEYDNAHVNNTMYGYGATGEVKKDTLATGDYNSALNLHQ